jgi:hypothetical protein
MPQNVAYDTCIRAADFSTIAVFAQSLPKRGGGVPATATGQYFPLPARADFLGARKRSIAAAALRASCTTSDSGRGDRQLFEGRGRRLMVYVSG